jgi:hypothetical protein
LAYTPLHWDVKQNVEKGVLTGEELGLAAGFGIEVDNRLQSRRRLLGSVP